MTHSDALRDIELEETWSTPLPYLHGDEGLAAVIGERSEAVVSVISIGGVDVLVVAMMIMKGEAKVGRVRRPTACDYDRASLLEPVWTRLTLRGLDWLRMAHQGDKLAVMTAR